ncbi:helix-turn-helix domain-containing protein [Streptomyces sp. E11-3]|uniref:MmyB family transcriptional regulator n=1 Tax=Streptomyces sp. E11-3 TaxID=3110112 RepID=UPI00398073AE
MLRAWRGRVVRRNVGLYAVRNSTTGLSQAEVARLVGVSEGWYRSLERGTRRDFSDSFLLRVTEALQLSEAEELTLFLGATGRQPPADPARQLADIAPEVLRLLEHQAPNPAYISDGAWNIVATNSAMATWFPWSAAPRANILRWALLAPEARTQLVDWEKNARAFLAMLRLANNRDPGNSPVRSLTRDILATDADCRRIWAEDHDVIEHLSGHRFGLRLPVHGDAEITVVSRVLRPMECPESRFVVITRDGFAAH